MRKHLVKALKEHGLNPLEERLTLKRESGELVPATYSRRIAYTHRHAIVETTVFTLDDGTRLKPAMLGTGLDSFRLLEVDSKTGQVLELFRIVEKRLRLSALQEEKHRVDGR